MKVIDLLNKIANDKEVPTTIKYQDNYYNLIRKYNDKKWFNKKYTLKDFINEVGE